MPQPQTFNGFPPAALKFLADLKKHNKRPWFQAHKEVYEESVKAPMVHLILSIAEAFRSFAPEMVADPRVSLYRIYQDTRFHPERPPYKTHVAASFPVRGLPKNLGPSLYFHLSPEELFVGGGIYMPEPQLLRAVRQQIAASPRDFLAILKARPFRDAFGELEGEKLKSVPRGFDAHSEAANYLRYKQFLFGKDFRPEFSTSSRLLPAILDCFKEGMPLIRFLKQPALASLAASQELADPASQPRLRGHIDID